MFWTFSHQIILAQKVSKILFRADSLFKAGAYEQAYPLYRQIFRQERQASPQLLLRMAYVQEGLGHYPAALYYLNLAQTRQPRHATWHKIAELAQNQRVTGYPDSWRQSLIITFRRYYYRLLQLLLIAAVISGTLLLIRRRSVTRGWWLAYACYLGLVMAFLNVLSPNQTGIVASSHAALMTGPGAGAAWLTTAAAGDRLIVRGRQDIWYQVEWRGQAAYIRRSDLLLIK
ncbi:hypothetical protein BXP70_10655 [Hymenobacter crusticola]|uniref:SH3b domain-containing protein n=2 Tax=Hymenobacter crusticola TaxID=1770526 RepID=A0A243WG98_9BACT|nr:hypothetical protein BXP70_10655 [Hymenobacter crusticola]